MNWVFQALTSDPRIPLFLCQDPINHSDKLRELTINNSIGWDVINGYIVISAIYKLMGIGRVHVWYDYEQTITYPSVITLDMDEGGMNGVFICINSTEIYYVDYGNQDKLLDADTRIVNERFSISKMTEDILSTYLMNIASDSTNQELKNMLGWYNWHPDGKVHIELSKASSRNNIELADLLIELERSYYWMTGYLAHHPDLDWNRNTEILTHNYHECINIIKRLNSSI